MDGEEDCYSGTAITRPRAPPSGLPVMMHDVRPTKKKDQNVSPLHSCYAEEISTKQMDHLKTTHGYQSRLRRQIDRGRSQAP
jgi:hypothetical protein